MARVAHSIVKAEKELGLDAVLVNPQDTSTWEAAKDADVHISHTHFPDSLRKEFKGPVVWVSHGTPEHVFETAVEQQLAGYGHHDAFMLAQNWLRTADAMVTFWPRHKTLWDQMCHKGRETTLIPLGVDKSFWKPGQSKGKYSGTPSVFTCENAHRIKWPLDLFYIWPWIREELADAFLHCAYLPKDMHRWFFPLINANGCAYGSHISPTVFDHDNLKNAFYSTDFFIGLVRYGDFNRLCLEANACGSKTISYRGNPYSDYWITEGDQREMAKELIAILKNEAEPREKDEVLDISETAKAMKGLYERL